MARGPALCILAIAACGSAETEEPVPPARIERSLVWTDSAIVDDPALVGLGRLMRVTSDDGHGGRLFDTWLRAFATTTFSQRTAPAELADRIALAQGADPSTWDLDQVGFIVTAVHNRIDLASRDGGCGQLRVSLGLADDAFPFHLIFLFRQVPGEDDVDCRSTARRWARLSSLDGADFVEAAAAWLDEGLTKDRFLLAESIELGDSEWEWRQWIYPDGASGAFDNPPLFQTIDPALVNAPGPLRDEFLGFVAANAADLAARTVEVPAAYRSPALRVTENSPPPAIDVDVPGLASSLAVIGCPACHTADGTDFVQTPVTRIFSPFYEKELRARAARLDLQAAGETVAPPPFGPLQDGF